MHARLTRRLGLIAVAALAGAVGLAGPSAVDANAHVDDLGQFPTWQGAEAVSYCPSDGADLTMTLFAPALSDHPVPVIVQVHGGGWRTGARLVTPLDPKSIAAGLIDAGFAVASIDYRMQPAYTWPAPEQDLACAVRYLRSHADSLGLDPDRIGAWGESAGGQMVGLLGTDPDDAAWASDQYSGISDRVEAVVDEFGPSDLTGTGWSTQVATDIQGEFGAMAADGAGQRSDASPIDHVAAADPPFLIMHGTDDVQVPVVQSERLADRLRSAGDDVQLVLVRGGGHGLFTAGEVPRPSGIQDLIVQFLTAKLKR